MDFNTQKNVLLRDYVYFHRSVKSDFINDVVKNIKSTITPRGNSGQFFQPEDTYERQCWDVPIFKDEYYNEFLDILNGFLSKANESFNFDLLDILDLFYFEYSPKDNFKLDWHMDIANSYPYNLRKLSFSFLVNDPKEYEGGQLEIFLDPTDIVKVPKTAGGLVVFPSYLPHRVTPITKGFRKVFVGFLGGRPFR